MPLRRWGTLGTALSALSVLLAPMGVRADPGTTTVHVVESGETLSQIALDAGVDQAAVLALNGLDDPNFLVAGQSLKLPGAGAAPTGAAIAAPAPAAATRSYTVAAGDTLWAIARQFATTTDELAQLNDLSDANRLSVGAVLTLPGGAAASASPAAGSAGSAAAAPGSAAGPAAPATAATPPSAPATATTASAAPARRSLLVSYTVQQGETLNGIARQFDLRADAIVKASALDDPNKIAIGSVLKVPVPAKEHVVTAGETLRDIAAAERVDLGALIDFNQIDDPALIRVGQVVLVPVPATQQQAAAATPAAPPPAPPTTSPVVKAALAQAPAAPAAPAAAAVPRPPAKAAAPVAVVQPPKGAPSDGLIGAGLKLLGAPYVFGGSSPSGFDCSGLIWYAARQAGKQVTRGLFGQYNGGAHPSRDELKPGDLVFFQNTYTPGLSHNGIYLGNGQFLHAADEDAGVTISSLSTAYWSSHWFGATRLP